MRNATYKLAGEVAKERGLAGIEINLREAESLDEFHTLVQDGKSENVLKLAQGQLDIIVQRYVRNAAEDEVTADILAGKTVEINGEKTDFSGYDADERMEAVKQRIQEVADTYLYGARGPSTGTAKVTKEKAAKVDKVMEAAKSGALSDSAKAELAALGFTFE